jgi:hypothetical protein
MAVNLCQTTRRHIPEVLYNICHVPEIESRVF